MSKIWKQFCAARRGTVSLHQGWRIFLLAALMLTACAVERPAATTLVPAAPTVTRDVEPSLAATGTTVATLNTPAPTGLRFIEFYSPL